MHIQTTDQRFLGIKAKTEFLCWILQSNQSFEFDNIQYNFII